MPGADDCWTDHRLLITKLKIKLRQKPRMSKKDSRRKYDVEKLKNPAIRVEYQETVQHLLATNPPNRTSVDSELPNIRTAIKEGAESIIGFSRKRHQDWFDENDTEIEALGDAKRKAHISHERDQHSNV